MPENDSEKKKLASIKKRGVRGRVSALPKKTALQMKEDVLSALEKTKDLEYTKEPFPDRQSLTKEQQKFHDEAKKLQDLLEPVWYLQPSKKSVKKPIKTKKKIKRKKK